MHTTGYDITMPLLAVQYFWFNWHSLHGYISTCSCNK